MTRLPSGYAPQSHVWTMVDAALDREARDLAQQTGLPDVPQAGACERGRPLDERRAVLVVDDEPSIVEVIGEVLEEAGYRVLAARNGRTALATARRERPALVLTDRNMPEIDGVEFVRRMRASAVTAGIPVVIMSSTRPTTDGLSRVPFLAKPFDLDDLLDTVVTHAGPPVARKWALHG